MMGFNAKTCQWWCDYDTTIKCSHRRIIILCDATIKADYWRIVILRDVTIKRNHRSVRCNNKGRSQVDRYSVCNSTLCHRRIVILRDATIKGNHRLIVTRCARHAQSWVHHCSWNLLAFTCFQGAAPQPPTTFLHSRALETVTLDSRQSWSVGTDQFKMQQGKYKLWALFQPGRLKVSPGWGCAVMHCYGAWWDGVAG